MNMIHTPNKTFSIEPLQRELMELKGMVDSMCQTRSELCDVLDKLRTDVIKAKDSANGF